MPLLRTLTTKNFAVLTPLLQLTILAGEDRAAVL